MFTATISGASNTAVAWSAPAIGTITSSGVYTVPSTLNSPQNITLTAKSLADPTKTASATIALIPTVTVTLSPASTQLIGGQSTALNGSVSGTANTAINWSASPQVGTVSNGVYTAPAIVASAQTVTVTATSQASPTITASTTLSLIPISVAVNPSSVSLTSGQSKTFTPTVTAASNSALNWTVTPAVGTVVNGVYTAPNPITTAQTVTVKATSVADDTKSASSTVSLQPTVSVKVTPSSASLTAGQSVTLNATVTGSSNTSVSWVMSPSLGTLANGIYTAPATITAAQTIIVQATSTADTTKSDTSAIYLIPTVSISVTPSSASLMGGQSTTLNATVTGSSNTAAVWSMTPSVGALSNGVYTAPAIVGSAQTITVRATSSADATKSDTAAISLVPVSISVSPSTGSLSGGQSTTLTATVTGSSNTAVNWSMNPSVGTLTNGVYKAPGSIASAQTVTITASSVADASKSDTAAISLIPTGPGVSVSVSPSSASLDGGQSATLTATVTGSSNTAVTWSMSPSIGTLSNGVYKAPDTIASAQTVTITATSAADTTKSDTAAITLVPVSITVSPSTASLTGGQSSTLKATVTGSGNNAVTWSMSPSVGTLSNGVYTAPATVSAAQTVTVKATSAADSSKSATAAISLAVTVPVSISVTPTTASLKGGKSTTIAATVTGSTNTAVNWSLSPSVGTVTNGVYTAPAVISLQQTVAVLATSVADPTKVATATVTLVPTISVAILPLTATLSASQTMQFSVSLSGTTNPNVSWTFSPNLGSLNAGLYQAPATVNTQRSITVTATSLADTTQTASATITLLPTVGIALTPSSVSLSSGQSTQFNVTIGGTATTDVTWTLAPPAGSVTNGVYMAPAKNRILKTIILTAASIANPALSAAATITLTPDFSVSPVHATLNASQTQQFTIAGLAGSPIWSINPPIGSINAAGLYSAPNTVANQTTVTVTATDPADSTNSTSASLTLAPATTSMTLLPLEVMGSAGTTGTIAFNIPEGAALGGQMVLTFRIHGLGYQSEASLQVNGGEWTPINDSTVTIQGLGAAYGGIGGGFATLDLTMNLPAGSINPGQNSLTFRFNGTDGIKSGYRVIFFNVLNASGNQLIGPSNFVFDDSTTWQPPLNNPADIQAGQTLWNTASLASPLSGTMRAKCGDCHTQDGRDLAYFNYSNLSIRARSMFHGLTAHQGDQIASYIRTLNVPVPSQARPWRPPYQPGPGLDSLPVEDWAAGAGLNAVLTVDSGMLDYMMPGGNTSNWAGGANLNQREVPIAFQLPDWNRWLPIIHPMDAWADDFETSAVYGLYQSARSVLRYKDRAAYQLAYTQLKTWDTAMIGFVGSKEVAPTDPAWNDPSYALKVYSTGLWSVVKNWELNQEFGLEGMPQAVFGAGAEPRAWLSHTLFMASPNMLHLPQGNPGVGNGSALMFTYFTQMWYQLQLILDDGNGTFTGNDPIDFPYTYNFIGGMAKSPTSGSAGLMLEWLIKGLQASNTDPGPEFASAGWQPSVNDPWVLARYPNAPKIWYGFSDAQRTAALNGYLSAWYNKISTYKPQEFWTGGWADPNVNPDPTQPNSLYWGTKIEFMIPNFAYWGTHPALITKMIAFGATVWPNFNWQEVQNATCYQSSSPWLTCNVGN